MAKKQKHFCYYCRNEDGIKNRKATHYCPECETFYCKECVEKNNGECAYCEPPRLQKL